MHSALENIVPKIVLRIRYNKAVKVLLTLVHYRNAGALWACRHGLKVKIAFGFTSCYIQLLPLCNNTHSAHAVVLVHQHQMLEACKV